MSDNRLNEPIQARLGKLQDCEKTVLFLALCQEGLPSWASGKDQWKALAGLTDWPKEIFGSYPLAQSHRKPMKREHKQRSALMHAASGVWRSQRHQRFRVRP